MALSNEDFFVLFGRAGNWLSTCLQSSHPVAVLAFALATSASPACLWSSSYDLSALHTEWHLNVWEGRKEDLFFHISSGQWQSSHSVTLQFLWPEHAFGSQIDSDFWGGYFLFSLPSPGTMSRQFWDQKMIWTLYLLTFYFQFSVSY